MEMIVCDDELKYHDAVCSPGTSSGPSQRAFMETIRSGDETAERRYWSCTFGSKRHRKIEISRSGLGILGERNAVRGADSVRCS